MRCAECGDLLLPETPVRKTSVIAGTPIQGAPIILFCQTCQAMIDAIARCPGLLAAHELWEQENKRRIRNKRSLLSSDEGPQWPSR
jgi:rubredoxin